MFNFKHIALAMAGLATLAPASATFGRTIVVGGPVTLIAWSARVWHDIDHQLQYPDTEPGEKQTGIVAVKFNCSETGAPADVTLYKSSGSNSFDRAALRAVRHVATLHPLPDGMAHGQQFVVRILFTPMQEDVETQMRAIRAEAEKSNAWFGKTTPATAALIDVVPPAS